MLNVSKVFTKTYELNESSDKEWYTRELKNMKKCRDDLYKKSRITRNALDWDEYYNVKRTYSSKLNKTKSEFIKGKLKAKNGDQKGMWYILKQIISGKSHQYFHYIEFKNYRLENNVDISEHFNKYFVHSVNEIYNSIPTSNATSDHFPIINSNLTQFKFDYINENDLILNLKNMKNKKDYEGVNTQFWLDAMPSIGYLLVNVLNLSFEKGIFPDAWKLSVISPIQKVKGSNRYEDFRPINSMVVPEKIMEYEVKKQLLRHIDKHKVLINEQSGYRRGHSCESALNYVVANWKSVLDKNKIIVCVFIDLKRAFETVDRGRLLKKLSAYEVRETELEWFKSYLSNRRQRTVFQGELSGQINVELGVPQGSILGPILFVLYINDINKIFKFCKIKLFADDTLIYIESDDVNNAIELLNQDLLTLSNWLIVNRLKINVLKTKYMVLSNAPRHVNVDVLIENIVIEKVSEMKYLGCFIDEKLNFGCNANNICKKVGKKLGFLGRISHKLDFLSKITVYNTIVMPHFRFCSTLLFLSSVSDIRRMQVLQNKAMRVILKCNKRTNVESMRDVLNWFTIWQSIVYDVIIFMFKIKNQLLPSYMLECFGSNSDMVRETRSKHDFKLNRCQRSSTQKSLMYNGAKLYNNLPTYMKNEANIYVFKNTLKKYVKDNY